MCANVKYVIKAANCSSKNCIFFFKEAFMPGYHPMMPPWSAKGSRVARFKSMAELN
jgi:hypothetical protein